MYYSLTLITVAQLSPKVVGLVIAVSLLVVMEGIILAAISTVYLHKRHSHSLSHGVETMELAGR